MEFYSRTNKPKTIAYPESKKTVSTFGLEINKDTGKKELKETGKTNIYDKIQASKDQTMVYNILDRYRAGDVDAINKVQGQYGNFINVPRTLAEAQQQLIDAEKLFMSMPLEVRKEFNHSTSEFLASAANGSIEERLSKFNIKKKKETIITATQPQQAVTPQNVVTPGQAIPDTTQVQPTYVAPTQTPINQGGLN